MRATPSRYWHTIKHLKAVQVWGRVKLAFYKPSLQLTSEVPTLRPSVGHMVQPARRHATMLSPNTFRFLSQSHVVENKEGWNDPARDKLWLYNLHYFDDLNALGHSERNAWHCRIIERWIAENRPVEGNGWEPYPLSLRISNWVKWIKGGATPTSSMLTSLFNQARWLRKRLEWHLLGNHLFANAKALVLAGLLFEGDEANEWLRQGLRLADRQISEQILEDGGNFERSPMYHAIFLEDVLDLISAGQAWPGLVDPQMTKRCRDTAQAMLDFLLGMTHPDGHIAHFNDCALDIAPSSRELQRYAADLDVYPAAMKVGMNHWPSTGYVRLDNQDARVFLDVAQIGPDYLPGHAHADTLSFEFSLFEKRLVVNGGTSCYGLSETRHLERSTISHSTVQVGGLNSSDVWAGFRVGRRAYPFDLMLAQQHALEASCSHNGYTSLAGKPVHRRKWLLEKNSLVVMDHVSDSRHNAIARFVLHPEVTVSQISPNDYRVRWKDGDSAELIILVGAGGLEQGYHCPRFGERRNTTCLAVTLVDGRSEVRFEWN
jgi:uncharacterized heparinase superfamily protein